MKEVPQKDIPEVGGGSAPDVPGDCIPLPPSWDDPWFPAIPGPELPYTEPI